MQGIQNDLYVDIRYLLPEPWVQVCDNGYISALGSVRPGALEYMIALEYMEIEL